MWRAAMLSLALGVVPAAAQTGWENELALELEIAEECQTDFLSQVIEREIDGEQMIMAKAHCRDGRVFDASRSGTLEPFTFSLCSAAREQQAC